MDNITVVNDIKSPQNKLTYRWLNIKENDLDVFLISDPDADKSSAAMSVRIGSLADTSVGYDEAYGLAHFCEHMLFMGSEKFPEENDYNEYLSLGGGNSNAWTCDEFTNYFFQISPDYFSGALDRFSQFFISPLFSQSSVEKEINAVDSENSKNLQNPYWKAAQLKKNAARKDHPISNFNVGNLDTLLHEPLKKNINIRDLLIQFHEKYYSANIMKLVLYSNSSLDELQNLAIEHFKSVPNKNLSIPTYEPLPYTNESFQKVYKIVPIRESLKRFDIVFQMDSVFNLWKEKPDHYLSHLIGHESNGSILALLKKNGWAQGLSAGLMEDASYFGAFEISIQLTEDGFNHWEDILLIIFQYIHMLKTVGISKEVWDELKTTADIQFRYKSKGSASGIVASICEDLHQYPPNEILSGSKLYYEFNPDIINTFLNQLNINNFILLLTSKTFENNNNEIEYWYKTKYTFEKLPDNLLNKCNDINELNNDELYLPQINPYLPKDLNYTKAPDNYPDYPILLYKNDSTSLYYKKDKGIFEVPKSVIYIHILSSTFYENPRSSVLSELFITVINELLNKASLYFADLAGIYFNISHTKLGLTIQVWGFHDKLHILLNECIDEIINFESNINNNNNDIISIYERVLENIIDKYKNLKFQQPYRLAINTANSLISYPYWSFEQKYDEIINNPPTLNEIKNFSLRAFNRTRIESLIMGNYDKNQAIDIIKDLHNKISSYILPISLINELRVIKLPLLNNNKEINNRIEISIKNNNIEDNEIIENENNIKYDGYYYKRRNYNDEDINSATWVQFLTDLDDNILIDAKTRLLGHLLSDAFFNQLRTIEQLGYIASSSYYKTGDRLSGIYCLVQSDKKGPDYLDHRIELFIKKYYLTLNDMSEETFHENVNAVINKLLDKPKNYRDEADRYWGQIISGRFKFDIRQELANIIKTIKKDDIIKFYEDYFLRDGINRRKFSAQQISKNHDEGIEITEDNNNNDDDDDKNDINKTEENEEQKEENKIEEDEEEYELRPNKKIDDIILFKRTLPLYPARPFIELEVTEL